MIDDDLKVLRKQAMRSKRIASEWASKLHDLVEDELPAAYEKIPEIAQSTYDACQEWEVANQKFLAAQSQTEVVNHDG